MENPLNAVLLNYNVLDTKMYKKNKTTFDFIKHDIINKLRQALSYY